MKNQKWPKIGSPFFPLHGRVHMTIENMWRAHIVVVRHNWKIGTFVPILLPLRPYIGKMTLEISI